MSTDATKYGRGTTFAMHRDVHSMSSAIFFPHSPPRSGRRSVEELGERGDSRAQLTSCPQGFQHAPHLRDALREARLSGHVFGHAIE